MTDIKIVTPTGMFGASANDDVLDSALRVIGVAFGEDGEWNAKYGATFENDVFMMHRFCWCESDTCLWCRGRCGCDNENVRYFWDGRELPSDQVWKLQSDFLGKMPHELYEHGTPEYEKYRAEWDGRVRERDSRSRTLYPAITHTCGHAMMANRAEGEDWRPSQSAPNFFFKPTGFRLWWYKYIGRDIEIDGDLPADFMQQIFATHPSGMTLEQAIEKTAEQERETAASFAAMFEMLGVTIK